MPVSNLLDNTDLKIRRARAIKLAQTVSDQLALRQVSAKIIGSLAEGRFRPHSDIDILITDCPRALKYRLESLIEDTLEGFAFDVVYLDELPPHRIERLTKSAVDARDLR